MKTWTEMASIQPLVSKMLTNGFKQNRVSHAYLFYGPKGTGKRAMGSLLTKTLFCKKKTDIEPCQDCKDCHRIDSGNHPDVHWISPDGQTIKKEQILHLQKEFTYTGMESNQKVYIIDQADRMTTNASNRLLKFLEEPNKETTAILLTENSQSILQTIRSRCQMMAFKPLNTVALQNQLMDKGLTEANARLMVALTNNLSDAMELDKDEWFANARKIVVQLIEVLQSKPEESLLFIHNSWMHHFKDREQIQQGLDLLLLWFKDLIYHATGNEALIVFMYEQERMEKSALIWSRQHITNVLQSIMDAKKKIGQNVNPALVMEQLTLQIQR
ncbi:DNA polymerase III subunit delta' [Aquibacillus sp. 3ASR75-11]|uniref:DNA polymerase III subunit delta n=1 Tax=Terrihalobacillus insolitus TaxID=2950438 RepID=A0A9X3WXK7_9BACI|nr:DNA polymerase III subunit delta' [Terrihalobacillus insolitus]MDC3414887.1 DNA polymerase III subunit delta' [Terrihalobacillus insolitus]MDC3426036.1 DNA polymerase III subunit delta' [Terrihalobacillus insolitus]